MRFYADKARRHHLPKDKYDCITAEINRMIEGGHDYSFAGTSRSDRGWVFCPEYAGANPLEISPAEWDARIFHFGPGLLPDYDFRRDSLAVSRIEGPPGQDADSPTQHNAGTPTDREPSPLEPSEIEGDGELGQKAGSSPAKAEEASVATPSVCLGTDLLTGAEVRWPLAVNRNPHLLVAGLPGMGKTTCLLNLCKQMLDLGIKPIVFSYHQDIDERLRRLVSSIRFVDYHGLGFNPLQVIDRGCRMAYLDVAGALRDVFVAIFPELGDIQGDRIRKAIKDSFVEKGWDNADADLVAIRSRNSRALWRFCGATRNRTAV